MQVVASIGHSAVALAAHTQLTPQRLLVDEYFRSSNGSYTLSAAATELATYLHRKGLSIALVPDVSAAAAAAKALRTKIPNSIAAATKLRSMQSTNSVLMVAPTAFGFNEQAAQDNSFMHQAEKPQQHSSLTKQVGVGAGDTFRRKYSGQIFVVDVPVVARWASGRQDKQQTWRESCSIC